MLIPENIRNIVMIGEAGSGKTELSLNLAVHLAAEGKAVHLCDLDQTKPLLRARDAALEAERQGITVHYQEQVFDSPTGSPAVIGSLGNRSRYCILDVGGGSYGAKQIGQFSEWIHRDDTCVLYIINPFRVWSGCLSAIDATMEKILCEAKLDASLFVGNPFLGDTSSVTAFSEGIRLLKEMQLENKIAFYIASEGISKEAGKLTSKEVFPIHRYLEPEWL